jgi:hypothetical protein
VRRFTAAFDQQIPTTQFTINRPELNRLHNSIASKAYVECGAPAPLSTNNPAPPNSQSIANPAAGGA